VQRYYVGSAALYVVAIVIQYVLLFIVFPKSMQGQSSKKYNAKYLPVGGGTIVALFVALFGSISLLDSTGISQEAKGGFPTTYEVLLLLPMMPVVILGLVKCTKIREALKKEEWERITEIESAPGKTSPVTSSKALGLSKGVIECQECGIDVSKDNFPCPNCGYPLSKTAAPRKLKLRGKALLPLLFILVGILVIDYHGRNLYPFLATKYFGIPVSAEVIETHCDTSNAVKDSSWVKVKYLDSQGVLHTARTGANRPQCSDLLIGKTLAIKYSEGYDIVTRDDGQDLLNTKFYIVMCLGWNLMTPLLLLWAVLVQRKLLMFGKIQKAQVVGPYVPGKVELHFEDGSASQTVPFVRARPDAGSTVWVVQNTEKKKTVILDNSFFWNVLQR
jgi:hypothetical protein